MNQKGFTMVEILVTVTILGLLLVMTYAGYTSYQSWAKAEAYDIMAHSARQAAEDYLMDNPGVVLETEEKPLGGGSYYYMPEATLNDITFEELEQLGYMSSTVDPGLKGQSCEGKVRIGAIKGETKSALDLYVYVIDVCCHDYNKEYVYTFKQVGDKYEEYQPVKDIDGCDGP